MPGIKGLSGPKTLKEIKKGILIMIIIYILKNGDIDIFILIKIIRDKVLSTHNIKGIKILKRDY